MRSVCTYPKCEKATGFCNDIVVSGIPEKWLQDIMCIRKILLVNKGTDGTAVTGAVTTWFLN